MLTSNNILSSELPLGLGIAKHKGQGLPQGTKFSELFSSMFQVIETEGSNFVEHSEMAKTHDHAYGHLAGLEAFNFEGMNIDSLSPEELQQILPPGSSELQTMNPAVLQKLLGKIESDSDSAAHQTSMSVESLGSGREANANGINYLIENALSRQEYRIENGHQQLHGTVELANGLQTQKNGSLMDNLVAIDVPASEEIVKSADISTQVHNTVAEFLESEQVEITDVDSILAVNQFTAKTVDGDVDSVSLVPNQNSAEQAVQVSNAQASNENAVEELGLAERLQTQDAAIMSQSQVNTSVTTGAQQPVSVQATTNTPNQAHSSLSQTQWGAASSEASQQAAANAGQNGQSFANQQGGQQNFAAQQQMMQFQEQRSQAIEQQMAVKAVEAELSKADTKEGFLSSELGLGERRSQLPIGLQTINAPVKSPQWGQALGHRVVFMANNQIQQAQLTLNPEKLGPVQVKLQMDRDQQMHVTMTAQHGTTREAMENAIPRLKEMLEQAGIDLASVDVSDQNQFAENQSEEEQGQQMQSTGVANELETAEESVTQTTVVSDNLVDYYA